MKIITLAPWHIMPSHSCEVKANVSIFISERSEFEITGNGHVGTALQNGCGPYQMSGGDAELGADEERRCQCRDRSGK